MSTNKEISKHDLKAKLKQGDEVVVIAGKDKGKRGVIKQMIKKNGAVRVLVEGVNLVKKHVKANPNAGTEGSIDSREASLDISNVKIYNSASGKGDRIGYRLVDGGRKVRYFKSTGELIES